MGNSGRRRVACLVLFLNQFRAVVYDSPGLFNQLPFWGFFYLFAIDLFAVSFYPVGIWQYYIPHKKERLLV
jgi:hypothetical protein